MKITIKQYKDDDYLLNQQLLIDDIKKLDIHPLTKCPEDAILERDMINCDTIESLLKIAFKAGKNNEDYSVEIVEEEF